MEDKNNLMRLAKFCAVCNKKKECNETPPHAYNNLVWHSCQHKKEIVAELFGWDSRGQKATIESLKLETVETDRK